MCMRRVSSCGCFRDAIDFLLRRRVVQYNWSSRMCRSAPDVSWHSGRGEASMCRNSRSKFHKKNLFPFSHVYLR